ncbi:MAG: hypothetical protein HY744_07735 [Deltaproteobacteria bacterium]|nr:hypothetical protein [Deltaproteobacteria bacterium]
MARHAAIWLLQLLAAASCSSPEDEPASPPTDGGAAGAAGAGGAGGTGPSGDIVGSVARYGYGFDLASASARAELAVAVEPPGGDCFAVRSELQVTEPAWNAQPAESSVLENGVLRVCGPGVPGGAELLVGARAAVPEQTFLGLDVGFSRQKDLAGGSFSYLLSWVGGCDHFGPCDDDPGRLSHFAFEVSHGPDDVVLCPGAVSAEPGLTRCTLDGTRAPTYSAFAIAADPKWVRKPFLKAAAVDIVFYEVPGGKIAQSLDPALIGDFMEWITSLLGPFPYGPELRLAGGPTAWLGFEHPANIILYEKLQKLQTGYADTALHVVVHEIVHQWAGDRTTLASVADFVWKEATCEYLTYVFEDELAPAGQAAASLAYWDDVSLQADYHPRPTDDPLPALQDFYGDTYGPGPMVLYVQLESMLGRDVVLSAIKSFLAEPVARSVADLKAALEGASGQDLSAYFDAWVFGSGPPSWPHFEASSAAADGKVTVTVTQQGEQLYGCAVEVRIVGEKSSTTALVDFGLAPKSPSASATVPFAEPVVSIEVDPGHRVIGTSGNEPASRAKKPRPVWIL